MGVVLLGSTATFDLELPSTSGAAFVSRRGLNAVAVGSKILRLGARPGSSEVDLADMLRLAVALVTASSCEDGVETPVLLAGSVRRRSKQACSARASLWGPIGCRTSSMFLPVAMFFEAVLRRTNT